jgi:mRNA interferase RelE/StbE
MAMYKIVFTRQASRNIRRIPQDVIRLIREKLDQIAADPYAQHTNVTKLRGRAGYRLRLEDWRVIYDIVQDRLVILVLKIGPRGQVYR